MKKFFIIFLALSVFHLAFNIKNCKSQWVQVSNGMGTNKLVTSLALTGNYIFAGTTDSGVYLSTNNGLSWIQKPFINNVNIASLAASGSNIFAGTWGYGLWRSTNYGDNWSNLPGFGAGWAASLAIKDSIILAGTGTGGGSWGIYRSTNNGQTWIHIDGGSTWSFGIGNSYFFAGLRGGTIMYSTNYGLNWSFTTSITGYLVWAFAVNGSDVFAGTWGYRGSYNGSPGLFHSTNNGTNWTQKYLDSQNVYSIVLSGTNIFVGTDSGMYLSTNYGLNWIQKNEGIGNQSIKSLIIKQDYVYAGTLGSSVWRRPLSELVGLNNINKYVLRNYVLYQNYPNPFNPATTIKFGIPNSGSPTKAFGDDKVVLKVYDILGKEIATLVNERLKAGEYEVKFDARLHGQGTNLPSGVYYYKLESGNYVETKKMLLIK